MEHFYKDIQGWFSYKDFLAKMIRESNDAHFVEIGTWKGKSAAFAGVEIANQKKNIRYDTIDWFKGSGEPAHINDPEIDSLYEVCLSNLKPVLDYVNVINSDSVEAAKNYEDGSVDFLILDGDHSFDGVKRDLEAWLPKIKEGGVLCADDWNWRGVKENIKELFTDYEVMGSGKGRYCVVRL